MSTTNTNSTELIASGRQTLELEAQAILALAQRIDDSFYQAVRLLRQCQGRVIVSGVGKSGHVARKIAATLASTGTPAFFVHAAEAAHGDLGMITAEDVVIAISYSGSGAELLTIVPTVKRMNIPLISITGDSKSELATLADVHLNAHVDAEACPLNLAPTTSTTVALALGDALAVACIVDSGFSTNDFARSHPGGALGKKLLTHVSDIMRQDHKIPCVHAETMITKALTEITEKGMGMTAVVDNNGILIGIFTDGDLRRFIEKVGDVRPYTVEVAMSTQPFTISPTALAVQAAHIMDKQQKNVLLVCDTTHKLIGALHMHDLMAAKIV